MSDARTRAHEIMLRYQSRDATKLVAEIAAAIVDAENAALERAASTADDLNYSSAAYAIRALKTETENV